MHWYVVHTYAGYENKVKSNLESRISSMNMEERIYEVVIPMEDVVEYKGGKQGHRPEEGLPRLPALPGRPRRRLLVRHPPDARASPGFVGPGTKPTPLSRAEVESILQVREEGVEAPKQRRPRLEHEIGETVRVKEGPFADFTGSGRRDQRGPAEAEGARQHLRPGDPGRARIQPGREALSSH